MFQNDKYLLHDYNLKISEIKNLKRPNHGKDHYTCFCTGWDNSPRARGRLAGIETLPNIHTFERSLAELTAKVICSSQKNKFLLNFSDVKNC